MRCIRLRTKLGFEDGDLIAGRRLADHGFLGLRREAAAFDHTDEEAHRVDVVKDVPVAGLSSCDGASAA